MNISVSFKPHSGQKHILDNARRFTTVNCGRRFGKTHLGRYLLCKPALEGYPVAFYAPTYKDLEPVWQFVIKILEGSGLVKAKNKQLKQIELITGGQIDFWSCDNPSNGRGRRYKRVIIDEAAKARDKIFKELWEQAIRPTLSDYIGDVFFLSTPKGTNTYWHDLCQLDDEDWINFAMPTSSNPFIDQNEIESARRQLDSQVFTQEYLAEFVDLNSVKFFYNYKESEVPKGKKYKYDLSQHVWISFDFNYSPCTASVYQAIPGVGIVVLREFTVDGGTQELCNEILTSDLMSVPKMLWRVTGDSSGSSKSATSGNITDYNIIQRTFRLPDAAFINTVARNRTHVYSRALCNQMLYSIPLFIDDRVKQLRKELSSAKPTDNGSLYKNRSDGHANDLCDTFRYFVSGRFFNGEKDIFIFSNTIKD